MTANVPTWYVQQYNTNLQMLVQQKQTRLRSAVRSGTHVGQSASPVDQIGVIDEPQDGLVELPRHMLGVSDIADALASEFHAITDRTIGVVEAAGVDDDAIMGSQHVAGLEVLVFNVGDEDFRRDRKTDHSNDCARRRPGRRQREKPAQHLRPAKVFSLPLGLL